MTITRALLLVPLLLSTAAIGPCPNQPLGNLDGGPGCDYQGRHHGFGQFETTCATCTCLADGEVACADSHCNADGGPVDATASDAIIITGPAPLCGSGTPTDGTPGHVVFDSDRAGFNRDIYIVGADGTGLRRLTTATSLEKEPSSSPDGRYVTFTSDGSGTLQIHLLDLTTTAVTQLTHEIAGADQSSFSHDGTLVAYHSGASVYVIHRDGSGRTLVATGLDTFNAYFWPHFTLADDGLVFDRNNEIDTIKLDGSGLRFVVQNTTTTIKSPTVSPSNGDVAYDAICFSNPSVASIWTTPFSVNTMVCKGQRVTPVDALVSRRAAWGPNDVFAYERVDGTSNVGAIMLISRTPGSLPCLLTPGTADNRNPAWAP